ncbi:D-alanine--D-alanine ligase [Vibrio sp.]|nr:D-alanine--D-alanine ligase [Vibrio sp.]
MSRPLTLIPEGRVNAGMPPLIQDNTKSVSPFEFLPSWFFYAPVLLQSVCQGLRYGDITLPLIANPSIKLSGMVGESKHDILSLAGHDANQWVSPFVTVTRSSTDSIETQVDHALSLMKEKEIDFPVVAKPDLGCRGAGVKLVKTIDQLAAYFESFPSNARFLIQEKAPYEAEAGVFYVRYPNQKKGEIISVTLKYTPSVMGDGQRTLKQLIEDCPRAGQLTHLYFPRHTDHLDDIIDEGQEVRLAFAGSHSRGSIFKDGNDYITQALTDRLDAIFDDFDGFHYGRLDIKFRDMTSFMQGEHFTILEVNGASSEAAHIWDSNTKLIDIFSMLLKQYRILFKIGAQQRQRGHKTPSIKALLKAWREEAALTEKYPETD